MINIQRQRLLKVLENPAGSTRKDFGGKHEKPLTTDK